MSVTAAPPPALSAAQVAAGLGVLAVALGLDPTGRLVVLPLAVVLLASGTRDLLLRPTLHADTSGLMIVHGLRRVSVGWDEVVRLRVVTDRRTPLLEVDLDDTVLVLSRRRLGRSPHQVLEALTALTPDR